jgi:pimeloyl-ACP methyl ester carboxylesterase
MTKDIIHFAHANGFPAKTYNKLFASLAGDFEIGYLERHGHNPKFSISDNWKSLKDELKEELENRYTKPVIGVGHSLGGILHLLVSVENPEFYKQIILLDAPIISRFSSRSLWFFKVTKLIDRYSPSKITRFRRNRWQSKEEAFEHFKTKPKFAAFDEDVLNDYIEYGIVKGEKGFELFFSPKIEARIYRTIPHHLPKLRGKLKVPTAYIGGKTSREARLARLSFMQKHFPVDFHFLEGSHLFPFEFPIETAEKIKAICS